MRASKHEPDDPLDEQILRSISPQHLLRLRTTRGPIYIQVHPDSAPRHVARLLELTRAGFYDGLTFHRVIDGFMAQTGDPEGTGAGGSGQRLTAEFSDRKHVRGTVSMARTADPDSADSQFFIVTQDAPWLNKSYTVWGTVLNGMPVVDAFEQGEPPRNPDRIISMVVVADVPVAERFA